jgi:hypothetical protein
MFRNSLQALFWHPMESAMKGSLPVKKPARRIGKEPKVSTMAGPAGMARPTRMTGMAKGELQVR